MALAANLIIDSGSMVGDHGKLTGVSCAIYYQVCASREIIALVAILARYAPGSGWRVRGFDKSLEPKGNAGD